MENAQLQPLAHLSQLVHLSGRYIDNASTRANSSPADNPQANTCIQSAVLTLSVWMRARRREKEDTHVFVFHHSASDYFFGGESKFMLQELSQNLLCVCVCVCMCLWVREKERKLEFIYNLMQVHFIFIFIHRLCIQGRRLPPDQKTPKWVVLEGNYKLPCFDI